MIILKNPDNGAPIDTVIDKKQYKMAVGETLAFDDQVGAYLQGIYGFLEKVTVVQDTAGKFKCPHCEYTNEAIIGVYSHLRFNHKDQPKAKPEAVGGQEVKQAEGTPIVSLEEQKKKEEQEFFDDAVASAAGKDGDGVSWYGKGLEKDTSGQE